MEVPHHEAIPRSAGIEARHLVKNFGPFQAVKDVSFCAHRGEVVGFLGPNGAGKSTTMKMLTGFLPPSEGSAWIGGLDIAVDPIGAKKQLGYLPERGPLYAEMTALEFLYFVGRARALAGRALRQAVEHVIDLCRIAEIRHRLLSTLSKGYRQRVGLAQALIHNPEVLILDEPTSGLDPNQLVEIRRLIKEISRNKTVIFSTHIMQEVQALCDRVIVIHRGQLVADDLLKNLISRNENSAVIVVEFKIHVTPEDLSALPGVEKVIADGKQFRVFSIAGADVRQELFRFAAEKNNSLLSLKQEENSMEEIFKSLTATVPA